MAEDNGNPPTQQEVGVEDLVPVRSRVSWGAVLAGSMIALAVYLVLTLFASSIGLSLSDTNIRDSTWTWVVAIAAIFSVIAALFCGGWVTTQLAVGENKTESMIHGVLTWGVTFAVMVWLVGMGVRTGYNAMIGAAYVSQATGQQPQDWRDLARRSGVPEERIQDLDRRTNVENVSQQAQDPAQRQAALDQATAISWWTLFGTLLSIAAAVGGALVGSGPTFRLLRVPAARMSVTQVQSRGTFTPVNR